MRHPDPERLTLAALPAEPVDPEVTAHLHGCTQCRTEVADLRRTVELARDGIDATLPGPPPRVWHAITAELGLEGGPAPAVDIPSGRHAAETNGKVVEGMPRSLGPVAGPGGEDAPGPTDQAGPPRVPAGGRAATRRTRWLRAAAVPLAAAVGLVVGLGVGRSFAPQPPAPQPVAGLAPVGDLDPTATGSVAMAAGGGGERRMVVQVRGVTNTAGGDHLEAWLMDDSGTRLVPLGPLDGHDGEFHGTFALPPGLPLGEFGRVDVSVERWDGNPAHSTVSVLRGDVA